MLKRGYVDTYHKMNAKHPGRYVNEFVGRHIRRELDTIEQMITITLSMRGKRRRYRKLIAND